MLVMVRMTGPPMRCEGHEANILTALAKLMTRESLAWPTVLSRYSHDRVLMVLG